MKTKKEELRTIIVTDCGSTTTKALLFQKTDKGWRQTFRGEAPTTVEAPMADVTIGAESAFLEIQELSGRKILDNENKNHPFILSNEDNTEGIDLFLSTSSAGGGLQMLVSGVVDSVSSESAKRSALGAGAIVLETLSANDLRDEFVLIDRIRHLKPDIVLLSGGVEGGASQQVIDSAELLRAANPKPRFGKTLKLPVVYAGNSSVANEVKEILDPISDVTVVANLRPTLEGEDLAPARDAIHEFFLSHVMSHSPGYDKLMSWSPIDIMPTPAAVGNMIETYANKENISILCADIGGATTDLFSVFRNSEEKLIFNRTVSANLGMSYSISQVLIEAGIDNLKRWIPFEIKDYELRDRLRNKMIRPTTIPQTQNDLFLEQAVCREALSLALNHHLELAVGLSGEQKSRSIADIFSQSSNKENLVDLKALDLVIGSGGVLSHAPNRLGACLMMIDGFELEGITEIAVDSIFMLPHLGALAKVNPEAASEIFEKDCLIKLSHAIAPVYDSKFKNGKELADVYINEMLEGKVISGELSYFSIKPLKKIRLKVVPKYSHVDCGKGKGETIKMNIISGELGFILDGRNRPIKKDFNFKEQKELFKKLGLMNE
jgi:uncharacterized protein (TIGR01319 family)